MAAPYWNLRTNQSPDLPDVLLHMTSRSGPRAPGLDPAIVAQQAAVTRLASILHTGSIYYSSAFDSSARTVSFTQTTRSAMAALADRYAPPVGIAIDKQAVWDAGGGPALYVRGDEWDSVMGAELPESLKAKVVRLWPGGRDRDAGVSPDEVPLQGVWGESQWMQEREWRLPRIAGGDWGWVFPRDAVRFLVLDRADARSELLRVVGGWGGDVSWIQSLPMAIRQPTLNGAVVFTGAEELWP